MNFMVRPRVRKILADLWGNRMRSLLVIASITVGLFAIGVIATLHRVMTEDLRLGYAAANPPNIRIVAAPFDQGLVDHLKKVEGVRQAEGLRGFDARLESRPGEWIGIEFKAVPQDETRQIAQVRLVEGKWPPGDREVVIEQYKFADVNAQIGEWITIELPSGKRRPLKVVGVVSDQTVGAFASGPGFFLAPVQGYVNQETVEWLQQDLPYTYNMLYITVDGDSNDETRLWEVANRVRDEMEHAGGTVINIAVRGSYDHPNRRYLEALAIVLVLLGFLIVFLSGFLITNTMQAIIQQQIQQIGILKTLGSRRYQIILLYMGLILVFGAIAALTAAPLAYRVAFQRVVPLAKTINMAYRGPRFLPHVILLQAGMGLLVPQLAALVPILQGSRISVREALSGVRESQQGRRGWFDRMILRLRGFSRPTLISIRNTFRRKGRLLLTLTTLSLGGAIFIATFNVQVSMDRYVDMVSRYFLADVNLTLARPERVLEINQVLSDLPDVAYVEAWGTARSEMILPDGATGENVQLLAPPVDSRLVDPVMIEGRWVKPGDQNAIVLNERFMSDFPNLRVGDVLRLRLNGKETDWIIVGYFQLAGRSSGLLAYTSRESLLRVINQPDKAVTYRIVAEGKDLSKEEQEALGRAIEARMAARGIRVLDVTTGSYLSSSAAQGFAALTGFLLFLASLTALVGSIGLTGAMSLNVMERTREIGILRAIGATNRILLKLILTEGMLIGFLSWIIAVLAAFPISKLLSDSISQALFGNPSTLAYTPTGFLLWLGAVLILSALASILPARNAARLTIREVLAYE